MLCAGQPVASGVDFFRLCAPLSSWTKMNQPKSVKPRGIGKKISLVCAGGSFTCAFLAFGFALWSWRTYGTHVYTGSLFATTFFFFTAAIVLYEMSRPQPVLPLPAPLDEA
jgi:hypothetical protein